MRSLDPNLLALLQGRRNFFTADLFTIQPPSPAFSQPLFLTSCDRDILYPANLLLASEDFSDPAWFASNTGASDPVVTPNFTTAPDGTNTADKIAFPDCTGGVFNAALAQDVFFGAPVQPGLTMFTFSCWVKTDTTGVLRIGMDSSLRPNLSEAPVANLTNKWQFVRASGLEGGDIGAGFYSDSMPAINIYVWGAQLNFGPGVSPYAKNDGASNLARWSSRFVKATRGRLKWSVGLTVDTLDMTLDANPNVLQDGVPILKQFQRGYFDGARFQYDRLYGTAYGQWVGALTLFTGNIADIKNVGRTRCALTVRSRLELLNNSLPRVLFQPSCRWTLFDDGCTLDKETYAINLTYVASGSDVLTLKSNATQSDGYFSLGTITFTSGENAGLSATVKQYAHSGGTFIINKPFPYPIANGDAFTAYPGCDRTQTACGPAKFNNLVNFGGFPYIPVPEAAF